jgi:hypothetical protein
MDGDKIIWREIDLGQLIPHPHKHPSWYTFDYRIIDLGLS